MQPKTFLNSQFISKFSYTKLNIPSTPELKLQDLKTTVIKTCYIPVIATVLKPISFDTMFARNMCVPSMYDSKTLETRDVNLGLKRTTVGIYMVKTLNIRFIGIFSNLTKIF